GTIVPPHRSSFAQRNLGAVDAPAGCLFGGAVLCPQGAADGGAVTHQQSCQALALFGRQCGIAQPPQPPPHDKVTSIRGPGICRGRILPGWLLTFARACRFHPPLAVKFTTRWSYHSGFEPLVVREEK